MINKPTSALSGDLQFLTLADLLQLFGGNGSTGILRIKSPHTADIGVVYFDSGNPIEALAGDARGIDALFLLFGWIEGEFEFKKEPVNTPKAIKKSRMEIILDGLRMLDDNEISQLGPARAAQDEAGGGKTSGPPVIRGPLVDYMYVVDEENIPDGQEITVEGKHGGWIWVILEGTIEIRRVTDNGPVTILRVGDGTFVGSVKSLTMSGHKRSATAVACGRVQLGVLDSQRLNVDFTKLSEEFRQLLLSGDNRLRQITDQVMAFKAGRFDTDAFLKGKKTVIAQGDGENRLFRITQGEAAVVRHTPKGYIPLVRLVAGDFFGHTPVLEFGHEPDSASIFGSADLKVSRMDIDAVQGEFDALPPTWKNLMASLGSCVAATTQLACSAFPVPGRKSGKSA